ncbi:MAG: amino acid adenylation domain-containing protein, partial [Alcanivoracaceae bacterium]|nr:amino acid adenylation domain-containing protein [Alcanivoracaceae bacterium]
SELTQLAELIANAKQSKLPKMVAIKRDSNKLQPSYAQQRLWFIDQMENGSNQYNMAGSIKVNGDFNVHIAQQAFTKVIQRHEPLRTVFIKNNDKPQQLITEDFHFEISQTDLSQLESNAKQSKYKTIIDENTAYCFDLSRDLMLRVYYIKLATKQAVLTMNVHHIAFDGWSISLLMNEFSKHYQALSKDEEYILPPLTIQYADYAYWQRQWLSGEVLERQLTYWHKQLADLPQVHNLPLDFERPAQQTFNGSLHHFTVDSVTLKQLKSIAVENQATLFMLIHAAFSILLARYSNSNDIVIGSPVANRLQKELEPLIGFFVNTLVLRADCSDNPSFVEFLSQIKNTNLDAQVNQDVPFEHLVDRLNPARSTSHNALFQIMLAMNTSDEFELTLPNVSLSTQINEQVTAKFDLTLYATDTENLAFTFEYNTDLFKPQTIKRLAKSLQRLLSAIATDATQAIAELPVLGDEETHYLLNTLNTTLQDYPDGSCIHQLFEQQVTQTPDNVAVVFAQQPLSYTELNNKANQLAHYLLAQGLKPDDIVGLCFERSLEMMIAIIAIFKAGGAYLPLDPAYPQGRLQHMIADSGLSLILTQQHLVAITQDQGQQIILDNQSFIDELSSYSSCNPVIEGLNSRHLAYVIYTSGSTGLPKGVMVEHQALLNRIDWMQNEYQLRENDVVLQKTPFSFDVSVWEFTWFFTVGARLVMAEPEGHKDPRYLIDVIQKNDVTTLHFVPSMLRSILANSDWSLCQSLRQVFCSGEALPVDIPELHYGLNKALLHNLYGPTEAAIDVSYWQAPDEKALAVIPIGKPIQNMQLLVLNEQLQLQPTGSPGELFIAGVGLARGYLNQPELTAQRFIKNTFATIKGSRLYRTGDLVRYLDDGNIAFMGRVDHQVKLRGFRIELGEIEHQLSSCVDINASVAMIREDNPGQKHLVAYFTSDATLEDSLLIADIKTSLQNHLPDYMLPNLYVRLESMPLSANGKIDRKALPQPAVSSADDFISPE